VAVQRKIESMVILSGCLMLAMIAGAILAIMTIAYDNTCRIPSRCVGIRIGCSPQLLGWYPGLALSLLGTKEEE
jgi:hypothetical protein